MPKGMSEHHHTLDPIFGPVPIPGHQAGEGVVVLSIGNSIKKSIRMILDASFQKKCVYIYIYILNALRSRVSKQAISAVVKIVSCIC